jgi:hypothetical protein
MEGFESWEDVSRDPSWCEGNDFEAYLKGMIGNFESMRLTSDQALVVNEDKDNRLVSTLTTRYFTGIFLKARVM